MKRLLLLLTIACLFTYSGSVSAQSKVRIKSAVRYEITNKYDKEPETDALELVKPYKITVDSILLPVVAYSSVFMRSSTAYRPESELSNFIADLFYDESEKFGVKADLAILNIGGNRADIPEGPVRRGDIMALSPFNNYLAFVTLKGSDLIGLFEDIAYTGGECESRNVRLEITADHKLRKATLNGEPVNPDKNYVVITTDYIAEGNDYLVHFRNAIDKRIDSKVLARDVIFDYLKQLTAEGKKINAVKDGRCKLVE